MEAVAMDVEKLNNMKKNLVVMSMLELVAGLFMIICNAYSLETLVKVLGIIAAAYGVVSLLVWLVKKDKQNGAAVIITAVLGVIAGAALVFLTEYVMSVFTIIAGIIAAVLGIVKIPNVFAIKKGGFNRWYIMLIPVALTVAAGIVIGLNPFNSNQVTAIILGISLIFCCAADIIGTAGAGAAAKEVVIDAQGVENPPEKK